MAAWFFSSVLLLSCCAARGQDVADFTLFEPVDLARNVASSERSKRSSGSSTEARFSLVGTSRIGSKNSVILRHSNGEEIRLPLERPRMRIPGYEQYAVVGYESNSVSIQFPQSEACAEFVKQGVSCDDIRNIATLSLSVIKTVDRSQEKNKLEEPEFDREVGTGAPINPFEALRNRSPDSSPSLGQTDQFQPRRINPADVPPGMRLVSTPFGDRLIEE